MFKRPGGKTLEVEVEMEDGGLKRIIISGDFFAYPPEELENLERELSDASSCRDVETILNSFKDKIRLVGIDFEELKKILLDLLRC